MELDRDDPRPPYQQVAAALRAAILGRKFQPGEQLPSQNELATMFGVARMTVQQALRIVRDEGLTVSRQGSGVFVRERAVRPTGLRPHIERIFEAETVSIDFVGYTSETLQGAISEPLDKVRSGRLTPREIQIRILLPDMSRPLALPVAVSGDEEASARARARMAAISARNLAAIRDNVEELQDLGLVRNATVESRVHGSAPLFKAYILSGTDVFFGFYPVREHEVRDGDDRLATFDSLGKNSELFHYTDDGDPESPGTQFVAQARLWFDSVWDTIATRADS
jgi:DNA-binding transcriptional regulator YhcF (GntR family)